MLYEQRFQVETEDSDQQSHKQWFALCTRARHEKTVRERLGKEGYEEFLPTVTRIAQWSDRTRKIESPLFPGYCFARFENRELFDVLQVPGIAYVVGQGNHPESIPDEEIEAVRKVVTSEVACSLHRSIPEGQLVQIVKGPLAGIRGRLMRHEGEEYVAVCVQLIGLSARVKVHARDLIAVVDSVEMVEEVIRENRNPDAWQGYQLTSGRLRGVIAVMQGNG